MGKATNMNKHLDDLSFEDLYIEEDGGVYPNIGRALGQLKTKIKKRKVSHARKTSVQDDEFNQSVKSMRVNHLRRTGI